MKNRIATIFDLQKIGGCDCGETLVDLQEEFNILCDYRRTDAGINRVLVRKSVGEKLRQAQKKLSKNF